MNLPEGSLLLDLVWVSFWAASLSFSYLAVFRGIELLPLGDDRRAQLDRVRPLIGLGGALVFSLFSAQALFSRFPGILPIALLLVLVGFFLGSRTLLGDVFSGIALRAERSFKVGDHVRIGDSEGRVTSLGPRAVALETPEGDSALIPYSRATQLPIVRTRSFDRGASRSFAVELKGIAVSELASVVERAALEQHWGSVTRPPEISTRSGGSLEVTVFSLSEGHTLDVESAVLAAVERARQS